VSKNENAKNMVYTGLFIALGVLLPVLVHMIPNMGMVLLPMHIPILLCGLICGVRYGLICGLITPLLAFLLTGRPPAFLLPAMQVELAAYGAVSALIMLYVKTKSMYANVCMSLIGAMLVGRVVFGMVNALILQVGEYTLQMWLTAAFVTAMPGIVIQIIIVPIIVIALWKAKLATL
jgi:niacin transporter